MGTPDVTWAWHTLSTMPATCLHALLRLRQDVFVVEQDCAYADIDGFDPVAEHLIGQQGDVAVACLRVLPPGSRNARPSIGRICTAQSVRRSGIGRVLFQHGVDHCQARWPDQAIFISAQQYLQAFYADFGFHQTGAPYDEDGIAHIDMTLPT